ncbi:type II CAAX prenyl endopeptidase Rce1 family protein [Lactobacillus psittaci]|uniref:CAAX amino protease family protein n=1 Tax=Lactobacillus psittaci DSM 15354 TaxID=1122152 RepID=A0A0R1SB52_9LACO|nr:CPBP family glutamic-type intramembrane protease [Lactobacillus psittaci]KRL63304.1 CAAX amino protease family protein [Lactobacillus psittaci DSM 15354]
MNTPRSVQGNLIRYGVYLVGYLLVIGAKALVADTGKLQTWDLILFICLTLMTGLLYIYRFNREQRYFQRNFSLPLLGNMTVTSLMTIAIVCARLFISYLQLNGKLGYYTFQSIYAKSESTPMFWFLIIAQGVVIPVLQVFLAEGFFFNYLFRADDFLVAVMGLLCSGAVFTILNLQFNLNLIVVDFVLGLFLAWTYLYTQSLSMTLYLAVLNGILLVMMM